jgi:tetratricopeptide (TPR) repeat protein
MTISWMENKVNKFCVITGLLMLNAVSTPALAMEKDYRSFNKEIQQAEQQVRVYFTPAHNLSLQEEVELQSAQALIKTYRSEAALAHLEPLLQKYPDHYLIQLLYAETLMDLGKPQEVIESLDRFLSTDRAEQLTADQQFELQQLHARAYTMQGEPAMALRILKNNLPEYERLSTPYREAYFLLWAETHLANKQSFEAYEALQKGINSGLQSQESRNELQTLGDELAEKLYQNALNDYDDNDYAKAVDQLLAAYNLNPTPVKYSQDMARAQERFLRLYENRFNASRSFLANTVSNMRYAMSNRDYNNLYREYLRLQADRNVNFLLLHKEYLPVNMRKAIESVEETLLRQGLKIK